MWCPDKVPATPSRDLLATTGDYLRIWNVSPQGPKLEALLNNNKNSEYCAPLTSLDWNREDPSLLGTACIDTTCTIWDVNTQQAKTQIIAHDKEVYDIGAWRCGVWLMKEGALSIHVRPSQLAPSLTHRCCMYTHHVHMYVRLSLFPHLSLRPREGPLRLGRSGRLRAHVRSPLARPLHHHLRGASTSAVCFRSVLSSQ